MPKAISTAIGIDLGQHSLKAVTLQKKAANRFHLNSYAIRQIGSGPHTPEQMAHHLKLLLSDLGGSAKGYAAAVSHPKAIVRVIEQPPTPPKLLRDALKFNDMTLLNQDCKEYVLDCDYLLGEPPKPTEAKEGEEALNTPPPDKYLKYIVAGLPRTDVLSISAAFEKNKIDLNRLQVTPLATFNAFEFAKPELFNNEAFMLVDIGNDETVVLVGFKRELVLVRVVEYGGRHFVDAISGDGAIDRQAAITLIEKGDPGLTEAGRASLSSLAYQLRSSIGFFEGQRDQEIRRVHLSGALVRADLPLQILSDELDIPCELWDPFERCEMALPKSKRDAFQIDQHQLNAACGAALEVLREGI
ncbi:MAG: pilus assembly protein PilM [Verrucomicrobia bacterium]|nr:pilus assembly protein PilM [Verrucomicrobiota bacterium]